MWLSLTMLHSTYTSLHSLLEDFFPAFSYSDYFSILKTLWMTARYSDSAHSTKNLSNCSQPLFFRPNLQASNMIFWKYELFNKHFKFFHFHVIFHNVVYCTFIFNHRYQTWFLKYLQLIWPNFQGKL